MKAISEFDMKEICEAVENFSLSYRSRSTDIGHSYARAHGGLVANIEMLLYQAINCEDEALREYATEMVERFSKMKIKGNI